MEGKMKELRPDVDWEDSTRIDVLYSPFRTRSLNPEAYDSKMTFWMDTIEKWLDEENDVSFCLTRLFFAFTHNSKRPNCLIQVIQEMLNRGTVVETTKFISKFDQTWSSWALEALKGAPSMLWSFMSPTSSKSKAAADVQKVRHIQFLHYRFLEDRSRELFQHIQKVDNSRDSDFCKKSDLLVLEVCKKDNLDICLDYLKHELGLIDYRAFGDEVYIKNKQLHSSGFEDKDIAMINLKITISHIETSIKAIDDEITEKRSALKLLLVLSGSRVRAKSMLKQLKRLEKTMEAKVNCLDHLNILLDSIEAATENAKVIESLKAGRLALKASVDEDTPEQVDELMDDIKDLVANTDQVAQALANEANDDDTALDEELEAMIKADDEVREADVRRALQGLKIMDNELRSQERAQPPAERAQLNMSAESSS
jgi:ElaB/YqjD/DUF883 family membrane-anchored ribosome-binding protein